MSKKYKPVYRVSIWNYSIEYTSKVINDIIEHHQFEACRFDHYRISLRDKKNKRHKFIVLQDNQQEYWALSKRDAVQWLLQKKTRELHELKQKVSNLISTIDDLVFYRGE